MNIFVNCNNLRAFQEFIKTYSNENKKHHFIFGRQNIGELNRKGLVYGTDNELKGILDLNGIKDYEILYATDVYSKVPEEWQTDLFQMCDNMLLQYLAPWYIEKYISKEPLLCIEEDFILQVNLKDVFAEIGDRNRAIFSTLSLGRCGYGSDEANALLEISGGTDYYNDIYYRKIVGCPRYYKTFNVQANEEYITKFYQNQQLWEVVRKSKVWHRGYLDEKFHSYSPNGFCTFSTNAQLIIIGEKSIDNTNYKSLAKKVHTTMLHLSGTKKIEVLGKIMEAYYGKI